MRAFARQLFRLPFFFFPFLFFVRPPLTSKIVPRVLRGNSIIFRRSVPIFAEELREQKFPPN